MENTKKKANNSIHRGNMALSGKKASTSILFFFNFLFVYSGNLKQS